MPVAGRVGDLTSTGDTVTGPGVATVLIAGMPASVVGDVVAGAACTGSVVVGSPTVLIGGRPATRVGDQVVGTNPASGSPVTTAIAPPGAVTVMIGP